MLKRWKIINLKINLIKICCQLQNINYKFNFTYYYNSEIKTSYMQVTKKFKTYYIEIKTSKYYKEKIPPHFIKYIKIKIKQNKHNI